MLKRFLTLSEVRYWIMVIKAETWDDPDRRHHLWALVAQVMALIIPIGAMMTFILIPLGDSAGLDNTLDPVYPDSAVVSTLVVPVPQSPGPDYNTLAFCQDPTTHRANIGLPSPDAVGQMTLERGTERIFWTGSSLAEFSWTDADGKDQGPVQVKMSDASQKCFRSHP